MHRRTAGRGRRRPAGLRVRPRRVPAVRAGSARGRSTPTGSATAFNACARRIVARAASRAATGDSRAPSRRSQPARSPACAAARAASTRASSGLTCLQQKQPTATGLVAAPSSQSNSWSKSRAASGTPATWKPWSIRDRASSPLRLHTRRVRSAQTVNCAPLARSRVAHPAKISAPIAAMPGLALLQLQLTRNNKLPAPTRAVKPDVLEAF